MLESCLHQAGYRVGAYTSPHLQHVNERICVGNAPISDEKLDILLIEQYKKAQEWMSKELQILDEVPLTHFEILTAVALQYFSNEKVDIAIVEVGLGGRFDATNILTPLISIISSISLDHTELLGHDDASIAAEKAGIIKENIPVIAGSLSPEALRTIRLVAQEQSSALYTLGKEIRVHPAGDRVQIQFLEDSERSYPVPLLGSHQYENVSIAVCTLQLIERYFPVAQTDIVHGLEKVRYPGRLQWIDSNVLVDCAHNEAGARMLGAYLMSVQDERPKVLVFGASREKDIRSMILSLASHFDTIFTFAAEHPRAIPAQELSSLCADFRVQSTPMYDFQEIHDIVYSQDVRLVVCGSIFLVGAYLDWRESIVPLE
ncbi:MAG: hypothetical protein CL916_14405 [Deltaproteobacteria bacterium]|nr:hypothetical protein [Deltaproteobacteria bacterium]